MHSLIEALHCQMGLNKHKNHLHPDAVQMLEIHPAFSTALENRVINRVPPIPEDSLSVLSSIATDALVNGIYSLNQYLQVSDEAKSSLNCLYQMTLKNLFRTKDIEATLRYFHFPHLVNWIASIYPESLRNALRPYPEIGKVLCQEYSPELQLRLFDINLRFIKQPVLDIGCGKAAPLVSYLRAHNIEAFGIDRTLSQRSTYLVKGDWLNINLGSRKWGTVISNMAFTNHFIYTQHYDKGQQSKHFGRYKAILDSLQEDGSFIYAPSAPELELKISGKKYQTAKWAIDYGHSVTRVSRIAP